MNDRPRLNVESFNLDHTQVVAPYVRLADRKMLQNRDVVVKYDLRFCQPNVAHLDMSTVHSLEHLFAEKSRDLSDAVIDFSPMGCQTGFYLLLAGEPSLSDVLDLIERTLTEVVRAESVPGANEFQCGWAANHSLDGAQRAVREFLAERSTWNVVTR